jgi:hypothetical protein
VTETHGQSDEQAKRPGKMQWAGRRRPVTRSAGFRSHPDATGGEFRIVGVGGWQLKAGSSLEIKFRLPQTPEGTLLGFGGWYRATKGFLVEIVGFDALHVLTAPADPDWSKFGSQWYSDGREVQPITFRVTATLPGYVAFYSIEAGIVSHQYFDQARTDPRDLMKNKHQIAPEGNFYSREVHAQVSEPVLHGEGRQLQMTGEVYLKSCNRCARFLPINVGNERLALSFSNHCTAPNRVPCTHPLFSRLRNIENDEILQLVYGFQLECRFCKKFEVNAALNPQRTAGQMKEDATRRRAIELLLTELYGGSPSLLYRERTGGQELPNDVWERFNRRCFKCGTPLAEPRDMHLDHTRPLALLWPLDETATALCETHNSEKRDRPPVEFYDPDELKRLAAITSISPKELSDPGPNRDAIERLKRRLDWFFDDFLQRAELQAEHEGKLPAALLVKAIQKALSRDPTGAPFDIEELYRRR